MELVSFAPETAPSLLLPADEIVLLPIGDVQMGTPGAEIERLKRHIAWGEGLRERGHKVYYIGMGDYVDVASPSNRKMLKTLYKDAYDSLRGMITDAAEEHLRKIQKLLEPTRGHWVGLLSGHHFFEFEDGTNTDSRLAQFLETKYLGKCALVHLRFQHKDNWASTCKIWAHHGQGAGQSVSAAINKVMQRAVPYWMAHLYLIGHYHSKSTQPIPWIDSYAKANGEVVTVGITRYIVATGGFLAGYAAGTKDGNGLATANYIEDAMLSPNTLGAPAIFIRPVRRRGRPTIDINVSV